MTPLRWHKRLSAHRTLVARLVARIGGALVGLLGVLSLAIGQCESPCLAGERATSMIVPLGLVAFAVLAWLQTRSLVAVALGDGELALSTGFRTIRVPFANVRSVQMHRFPNQHASIGFAHPTAFGRRVRFLPVDVDASRTFDHQDSDAVQLIARLAMEAGAIDMAPRPPVGR